MIVLSREKNQSITIGDEVEVTVIDIHGDLVRVGVNAPSEMAIHLTEASEPTPTENLYATGVMSALRLPATPAINPDITIRPATDLDLYSINDIYNHYVANSTSTYQEQPDSIETRQQWLAHHGMKHPVTVAVLDRRVVGWGSLSPFHTRTAFRHTVESSLYVHHKFHRQGIGSALLKDLIDRAKQIGHHTIIAAIDSEQTPSLALHERFGFVRAADMREVGFKFGKWLDVIDLQLML